MRECGQWTLYVLEFQYKPIGYRDKHKDYYYVSEMESVLCGTFAVSLSLVHYAL